MCRYLKYKLKANEMKDPKNLLFKIYVAVIFGGFVFINIINLLSY